MASVNHRPNRDHWIEGRFKSIADAREAAERAGGVFVQHPSLLIDATHPTLPTLHLRRVRRGPQWAWEWKLPRG